MRAALLVLALTLLCAACGAGGPAAPGVLLVSVDTLRADHLGAHGSRRGLTPHLDALAREAVVFERAYAPAPFTRPAIASLLTGREPARVGVVSNVARLSDEAGTLAEAFAARGWATAAVVSNPVLAEESGLARGFQSYDAALQESEAVRDLEERTAGPTTEAALAALERLRAEPGRPWFLWVHYQDPHGPYTPTPGARERHLAVERERPDAARVLPWSRGASGRGGIPDYQRIGDERRPAFYRAGYAAEVAHVDAQVGRLLAAVGSDAAVVFAADHGEDLGENDYWFAHGEHLGDSLVRVPLWFRMPGLPAARRADLAQLADVTATLAERYGLALDVPARALLAPGAEQEGSEVFLSTLAYVQPPRFALLSGELRYTLRSDGHALREALVRDGADARDEAPEAFARLRLGMQARIREIRQIGSGAPAELSEAERRRLRALGYAVD